MKVATCQYVNRIMQIVGCVNDRPFRGYAPGTLRLIGTKASCGQIVEVECCQSQHGFEPTFFVYDPPPLGLLGRVWRWVTRRIWRRSSFVVPVNYQVIPQTLKMPLYLSADFSVLADVPMEVMPFRIQPSFGHFITLPAEDVKVRGDMVFLKNKEG